MVALLCFVLAVLAAPFKSKSGLEAENAVLRHQLIVLRRKVQGQATDTQQQHDLLSRGVPQACESETRDGTVGPRRIETSLTASAEIQSRPTDKASTRRTH